MLVKFYCFGFGKLWETFVVGIKSIYSTIVGTENKKIQGIASLREFPWGYLGEEEKIKVKDLTLCNPCHHTNYHVNHLTQSFQRYFVKCMIL